MAAQVLRRGQAIVWVPPRASGERAFATEPCLLAMLPIAATEKLVSGPDAAAVTVEGSGSAARYIRLSLDALPQLRSVTLVFDARDVTLLQTKLPPLSGARLHQALPNVVEDLLLQDAQQCGFALGPRVGEGERLVAAIDRGWLELVIGTFERRGAKVQAAWPAQLALPVGPAGAALACYNDGVALRSGPLDGLGWQAGSEAAHRAEAIEALLATAWIDAAHVPGADVGQAAGAGDTGPAEAGDTLHTGSEATRRAAEGRRRRAEAASREADATRRAAVVPSARPAPAAQHAATGGTGDTRGTGPTRPASFAERELPGEEQIAGGRHLPVYIETPDWRGPVMIAAARAGFVPDIRALPLPAGAPVDLLTARRGTAARRWLAEIDWREWRLPAALAAGAIALALLGLNLHWGMLAAERDDLRAAIERRYRQAFPEAQVVVDPVLQMERQVAGMRTRAGQSAPEDFVPLLTRFSQALGAQASDALAGVEYRDGRLRVRFKSGQFEGRAVRESLSQACQRLGLQLRFDADREPTATVALLR